MSSVDVTNMLSLAAVILTCICNLPQLYKTLKTKEVEAFEYKTIVLRIIICFLWIAYSSILQEWNLLISGSVVFVCEAALLLCKVFFSEPKYPPPVECIVSERS